MILVDGRLLLATMKLGETEYELQACCHQMSWACAQRGTRQMMTGVASASRKIPRSVRLIRLPRRDGAGA